jgi:hypothetical protein
MAGYNSTAFSRGNRRKACKGMHGVNEYSVLRPVVLAEELQVRTVYFRVESLANKELKIIQINCDFQKQIFMLSISDFIHVLYSRPPHQPTNF